MNLTDRVLLRTSQLGGSKNSLSPSAKAVIEVFQEEMDRVLDELAKMRTAMEVVDSYTAEINQHISTTKRLAAKLQKLEGGGGESFRQEGM